MNSQSFYNTARTIFAVSALAGFAYSAISMSYLCVKPFFQKEESKVLVTLPPATQPSPLEIRVDNS